MRKLIILLVCLLSVIACSNQENSDIPRIDKSLIRVDDLIWDLDLFQQTPKFDYLDSTSKVREILFTGPDHFGKRTKVFALYSNPDILRTGRNQGNKFPGVVLISGGHQEALSEWVERWAYEGYAAITCDYGNNKKLPEGGPTSSTELIYDSIKYGPKAVREYRTVAIAMLAHSLLLSFPEVEKDKTAVTGISWGGFSTCIVSGIDNRFKAAAPVYGCAFHDETIFNKYFCNMTGENKALWMSKIDPKNYLRFAQCPVLFINGNKDGCFDIVPFCKTTKLIPEEKKNQRITPDMGHDHVEGWRPREIAAFFNSTFINGIPLPKITSIDKQDTVIIFKYVSTTTLKRADFYYSDDTISINAERNWQNLPASVLDNKIVCSCPKEGFKFGFLYTTDIMDLSVSSELIIN